MKNCVTETLNTLCKMILALENDSDFDPLWRRFYQIQMYSYFLSKKNFRFELDNAEQAYDMIVKTWTDLKSYIENPMFPINDLDNIFKTTIIEFPSDEYTISLSDNNDDLINVSF